MKILDLEKIIERVKQLKNVQRDLDVCQLLGIEPSNLSMKRRTGSIPYPELIGFCLTEQVSSDWLLFGIEDKTPIPDPIISQIMALLKQIPDEERRRDILKYLQEKKLLMELCEDKYG